MALGLFKSISVPRMNNHGFSFLYWLELLPDIVYDHNAFRFGNFSLSLLVTHACFVSFAIMKILR